MSNLKSNKRMVCAGNKLHGNDHRKTGLETVKSEEEGLNGQEHVLQFNNTSQLTGLTHSVNELVEVKQEPIDTNECGS